MDSFWSSSPAGKIDEKYSKIADYTIVRPENPDISDIPMDAFVTDEVRGRGDGVWRGEKGSVECT